MHLLITAYRSFGKFRQTSPHLDTHPFSPCHRPGSVIALIYAERFRSKAHLREIQRDAPVTLVQVFYEPAQMGLAR